MATAYPGLAYSLNSITWTPLVVPTSSAGQQGIGHWINECSGGSTILIGFPRSPAPPLREKLRCTQAPAELRAGRGHRHTDHRRSKYPVAAYLAGSAQSPADGVGGDVPSAKPCGDRLAPAKATAGSYATSSRQVTGGRQRVAVFYGAGTVPYFRLFQSPLSRR